MIGQYLRLCAEKELAEGQMREFHLNGKDIILLKVRGKFYALDNLCTHDGGDLSGGDIINGEIECPRHGARFNIQTGAATRFPAVVGIGTYDVKIENGEVFLALPE